MMTTDLGTHAVDYARRGFQVFPLKPDKAPHTPNGMKDATTDVEQVEAWWQRWPDALIGCRIPEGICVLDIDPHSGGLDCWQALLDAHEDQRPIIGRCHFSGRGNGGFHAWFRHPGGKLSHKRLTGIDILHHGHRYTILPPSPHAATGDPYYWGTEGDVYDMPEWLAELLEPEVVAPRPAPQPMRTDSVADWFHARMSWVDILGAHGWTIVAGDGDSDGSKWRHPGATNAFSATIRHGCLFVYSPNTPFEVTEDDDPAGYTRFRAWSLLDHGGDMKQAARTAGQMPGAPRLEASIEWPDIIASHRGRQNAHQDDEDGVYDDEDEPEVANPLSRWAIDWGEFWQTDHKASDFLCAPILARGRGHALYAKAKTGKSLLTLEMAAAVATGSAFLHQPAGDPVHVLYVDYEMTPDDLAERLETFGYGASDDLSHLHYVQLPALDPLDTVKGGLTVLQAAVMWQCELVVIDTTARSVQGEENAMETFRDAYRHTFGPLKSAGITTLRVDHAGKDETLGQRGSSAKNDDVDVVWQLSAKADGVMKLKATHRRMGWIPEVVEILRSDDLSMPMHTTTDPAPSASTIYVGGTKELAAQLDELGVPLDFGRRRIRQHYDISASDAVLTAAQDWRRAPRADHPARVNEAQMRAESAAPPPAPPRPVDNPRHPTRHPAPPPKPQVTDSRHPTRHPAPPNPGEYAPPPVSGTRGAAPPHAAPDVDLAESKPEPDPDDEWNEPW